MLIEFSIQNYKSYSEKQTFSMLPGKAEDALSLFSFEVPSTRTTDSISHILKIAGIYGANASGKSNLFSGLRMMVNMARDSFNYPVTKELPHLPFKLDPKYQEAPTEFAVKFLIEDNLYEYFFSFTSSKIHREYLEVTPLKKGQHKRSVFKRKILSENQDEIAYQYVFDDALKLEKKDFEFLAQRTHARTLLLSKASTENYAFVREAYKWFTQFRFFEERFGAVVGTAEKIKDPEYKTYLLNLMREADLQIEDIYIEAKEEIRIIADTKRITTSEEHTFFHKNINGDQIKFSLTEESRGTQKFFGLVTYLIHALRSEQRILFIDEMNASLHPKLMEYVVSLFLNPEHNRMRSQIIFTTHDTKPFNYLHPDCLWLVDKTKQQSSVLTPLSAFDIKENHSIEKRYLEGRYGGLPNISELL